MNNSRLEKISKVLFKPVDSASLGLFRFLFGIVLLVHLADQIKYIPVKYIQPNFHFSYPFLDFIQPPPGLGMYLVFLLMFMAVFGIIIGRSYRICTTIFFTLYTYVFLIDTAYYKNHYYLVVLLSFWLLFIRADNSFTITNPFKKNKPIYYWNILILRFQFCCVYFFAGLAKINGDWLSGEPMRFLIQKGGVAAKDSILSFLYNYEWFVQSIIYGGLIVDLSIGFFLFNRKTRLPAAIVAFIFHILNHLMFPNILIFPFIMIFGLILFFEPSWPRSIVRQRSLQFSMRPPFKKHQKTLVCFLGIYCLIQIVLPLRHNFYSGDILWTSQGERFSWRMILKRENAKIHIVVHDLDTDEKFNPGDELLTRRQFLVLATRPEMILQLCHFFRNELAKQGRTNLLITVDNVHSINGRVYQRKIHLDKNLAHIKKSQNYLTWMYPFNSSLPEKK